MYVACLRFRIQYIYMYMYKLLWMDKMYLCICNCQYSDLFTTCMCAFCVFQTISELGIDSARQSSATPKSRVTSAVRRRGAYPLVGGYGSALSMGSPSRENVSTRSSVPLLQNTGGIFETLESHQVYYTKIWSKSTSML